MLSISTLEDIKRDLVEMYQSLSYRTTNGPELGGHQHSKTLPIAACTAITLNITHSEAGYIQRAMVQGCGTTQYMSHGAAGQRGSPILYCSRTDLAILLSCNRYSTGTNATPCSNMLLAYYTTMCALQIDRCHGSAAGSLQYLLHIHACTAARTDFQELLLPVAPPPLVVAPLPGSSSHAGSAGPPSPYPPIPIGGVSIGGGVS